MAGSDDVTKARLGLAVQLGELADLAAWRAALARLALVASTQIAREDTAQRLLFTIPADHEGHLLIVHGEAGSNAGTSAVLDVGRLGQPTLFIAGHSVLGAAGVGQRAPAARRLGVVTGQAVEVYGRYAEVGTPSTTGGPWTVTLFYSRAGN